MARVQVLKEAIILCGKAGITPFIWGHRGVGKSSIARQTAADNNMGFIDLRASQMEASDLRGLPDRQNGRTVFLPPADMPRGDLKDDQILEAILKPFQAEGEHHINFKSAEPTKQHAELMEIVASDIQVKRVYNETMQALQPRYERGIILLDELNRAQDDVQQAAFQFVLDRQVGQYVLPPGWIIVVAGNYNEGYQVSGFTDPAFLDRFCHMQFSDGETTLEDWIYYMTSAHKEDASEVIEFASQNMKHLDGNLPKGDLGFTIEPSRRSWELVVKAIKAAKALGASEEVRLEVMTGLIGREIAVSFGRYNCPVKPRDLMSKGVKAHHTVLGTINRGQLTGLMWGLVSIAKDKISDDAAAEVCLDFAEWMVGHHKDKDLAVAFCRALITSGTSPGQEKAAAAVLSNVKLAKMIGKYNAKNGVTTKTFIDRINNRPALQAILARVAWGGTGSDD